MWSYVKKDYPTGTCMAFQYSGLVKKRGLSEGQRVLAYPDIYEVRPISPIGISGNMLHVFMLLCLLPWRLLQLNLLKYIAQFCKHSLPCHRYIRMAPQVTTSMPSINPIPTGCDMWTVLVVRRSRTWRPSSTKASCTTAQRKSFSLVLSSWFGMETVMARSSVFNQERNSRFTSCTGIQVQIDGLVQERRNSTALAMELRFLHYPSKWSTECASTLRKHS